MSKTKKHNKENVNLTIPEGGYFKQPSNKVHKPKNSYRRKPKYGKKEWMNKAYY